MMLILNGICQYKGRYTALIKNICHILGPKPSVLFKKKIQSTEAYTKQFTSALWIFFQKTRSVMVPRFRFFPGLTDKGWNLKYFRWALFLGWVRLFGQFLVLGHLLSKGEIPLLPVYACKVQIDDFLGQSTCIHFLHSLQGSLGRFGRDKRSSDRRTNRRMVRGLVRWNRPKEPWFTVSIAIQNEIERLSGISWSQ